MRSIGLLVSRLILGAYLAVHGAQKLFGSFGGHGLDATGARFEHLGMTPGKVMAGVAGASELAGGVLTATGVAYPLGPLAIAGTMVVASTTHRQNGALAANGGFELPLTNFAVAAALLSAGQGHLRLGPHASKSTARLAALGGAGLAAFSIYQLLQTKPAPVSAAKKGDDGAEREEAAAAAEGDAAAVPG
jgi:putative oxidoreductase